MTRKGGARRSTAAYGWSAISTTRFDTIYDVVLLNALRKVPSTEAALEQVSEGIREKLSH